MRLALLALLVLPTLLRAAPDWQPDFSKKPLSSRAAAAYCAKRGKGWRLPTKAELPDVGGKLPDDGYLWSGEDVSPTRAGQRWIMNLANKHIFNGDGRTGYAKCVKGSIPVVAEKPLVEPYAIIGKVDATLTVVVALQPDYPWWKIRPTLDELAAKHSVKFDLRAYIVFDKYKDVGIAYCTAARMGKLPEFEAVLKNIKPKAPMDAKTMNDLAVTAGLDAKEFDKVGASCLTKLAVDRESLEQRHIEAVPTFWVGTTTVVGAKPDELRAAVEAALKP